jgi:hypothetical protein
MPGRFVLSLSCQCKAAQGCDDVAALFVFSEYPCKGRSRFTGVQVWVWLPVVPQ